MGKNTILLIISLFYYCVANAQLLYVDYNKGRDTNSGNAEAPLKTIEAALAKIENSSEQPAKVILSPGIYYINKTINIKTKRNFTKANRFVIEAEHLPNDANWKPELMPVLLTTAKPDTNFGFMFSAIGVKVDMSHVSIKGIKFCGQPSPQVPVYPIARENPTLLDLEVTQCLFMGDNDASYIQVGVIAPGSETSISHCIFYNCSNAAVFWFSNNGAKYGNSFSNNIVFGAGSAAVWTSDADSIFSFHHNIISGCRFAFIKNYYNTTVYSIRDCIISGNENYKGTWTKEGLSAASFEIKEQNIIKTAKIELVKVEPGKQVIDKRYLHPKQNTAGYDIDAGLFFPVAGK